MNMKTPLNAALFLGLGLSLSSPTLQADTRVAEMQAHGCGGCHGTQGVLKTDRTFMPLATLTAEEFTHTMLEFRNGTRPNTLMGSIALGYSEAEIRAMGEYFASQPE